MNLFLDSLSNRHVQQRTIIQIQSRTNPTIRSLENKMKRAIPLIGPLMTLAISSRLLAEQAGYSQTNLVSNTAGPPGMSAETIQALGNAKANEDDIRTEKCVGLLTVNDSASVANGAHANRAHVCGG
jgi:hypothetical protein